MAAPLHPTAFSSAASQPRSPGSPLPEQHQHEQQQQQQRRLAAWAKRTKVPSPPDAAARGNAHPGEPTEQEQQEDEPAAPGTEEGSEGGAVSSWQDRQPSAEQHCRAQLPGDLPPLHPPPHQAHPHGWQEHAPPPPPAVPLGWGGEEGLPQHRASPQAPEQQSARAQLFEAMEGVRKHIEVRPICCETVHVPAVQRKGCCCLWVHGTCCESCQVAWQPHSWLMPK